MSFRGLLLTVNIWLLGVAALFLGSQRPAGTAGQLLAFACILAQVVTISRLSRNGRERRRRSLESSVAPGVPHRRMTDPR